MSKKFIFPFLLCLFISLISAAMPRPALALTGRVLITEIKLGGGSDPKEFVEIYNDSGATVDLSTFSLEYTKVGFAVNKCAETSWKAVASPSSQVSALALAGTLLPGAITAYSLSMNDNAGGSLRLTTHFANSFSVQDVVRWGDDGPCFPEQHNAVPPNGSSLNRVFGSQGNPILSPTGNDFVALTSPTPGSIPCLPNGCADGEPEPPVYPSVVITELLPNPASPKQDNEDEYIELYNPNDFTVHLDGYDLYTGSSTSGSVQGRGLNGFVLQPHEYKALYSRDTGLGLVNSSSGQAWLIAPNQSRVTESPWYPADMGEDKAWAVINDEWQVTNVPTPNAANQATAIPLPEDTTPAPDDTEPTPCPEGKYRNPETNRCKTIEAVESLLAACKPGQERNPETNRCRTLTAASAVLAPCAEGQERNPDTNRCRKVAEDTAGTTACQEGYERNPQTNRCRKVTAVKAASTTTPSDEPKNRAMVNYLLMGSVSAMVGAYGLYEYRADVQNLYWRCKKRLKRGSKVGVK